MVKQKGNANKSSIKKILCSNRYNRFVYKVQWNKLLENSLKNYRKPYLGWIQFTKRNLRLMRKKKKQSKTPQNLLCCQSRYGRAGCVCFVFCLPNERIAAIVFFSIHSCYFDAYWNWCIVVVIDTQRSFCYCFPLWQFIRHQSCYELFSSIKRGFCRWWFDVSVSNIIMHSTLFPRSLASPINTDCCGQALKVYRFHCEPKRHIKRIPTSIPYFLLLNVLFQNTTTYNSRYFIVILAFRCLFLCFCTAVAIGVKECNIRVDCDGVEWKIKTVESNFCIANDIRSSIEWWFLWHAHSNLWQRWYI